MAPAPGIRSVTKTDEEYGSVCVCEAIVLVELLKRHLPLTLRSAVLGPNETITETTTTLLVVCSNGCFQKPSFVRQLFQAQSHGIRAVPIIVHGSFLFPSEPFYEDRALDAHNAWD